MLIQINLKKTIEIFYILIEIFILIYPRNTSYQPAIPLCTYVIYYEEMQSTCCFNYVVRVGDKLLYENEAVVMIIAI